MPRRTGQTAAALCLWAALAPDVSAQNHALRALRIPRLEAQVQVDGRLEESVWSQLEPTGDFLQTEPDEGAPSSERTEVLIFFDNDKLYFGFKCYESEPDKIVARLDTHDARTNSDSVDVFLDPFGDRRTGYWFSVNARGVQFESLLTEAGMDTTWDGIWESGAHIERWGWSAEIAIPFKSIRFAPDRPWGINLGRNIVRKNERAYWQFVTRFDGRFRPSKAGTLEGITGLEPGRNIEVIPYFSTRARRGAGSPLGNKEKYEAGGDIRWGLLPNLTANITVNPDFAETEADEINITISRFELFFPEKRAFFNEGSNFFATPLDLFFSRRVGERLPNGEPQRIVLGAKLTGKVGPWSLGLLEARTQATRFRDEETGEELLAPAANFLVARLQRDIWANSTLGFLTVNRDQAPGDTGSTQRAHAVDLQIVRGPHLKWRNQVAYTQNQATTEGGLHRVAASTEFSYETDEWEWQAEYKYIGRGVELGDLGFEPESDRHSAAASITWKPFLDRWGVRQVFLELNQDISLDTSGLTQDSGSDLDLSARFQNFWFARLRYSYDLVRFHAFTPDFGRLEPTRIYVTPRLRFSFNTNENRALYFSYQFLWRKFAQFRENYYGRGQEHTLGTTARLFGRTRLQFSGTWIREFQLDGTPFQMRRLFISRISHQFTPKLRARTLAQVSNSRRGQDFSVNSIVAYDFTARSALIVGYNHQRRSPAEPSNLGNEFFVKFSYLFHF